jgi:(2Fe-2S) ferredoxin
MFYEKHVFVCENKRDPSAPRPSCGANHAVQLRNFMKEKAKVMCAGRNIRINGAGCLDRCEEGPSVVSYPEGDWFRIENEEQALQFISEYLVDGKMPANLLMKAGDQSK